MGAISELRARLRHRRDSLRCDEAVELVTEYLEDAMPPALRERFERHLRACDPCVRYVDQVRRTVDVLGHLHPHPPTGPTREALLDAFRDFRRE